MMSNRAPHRTRVLITGVRTLEDALLAIDLGADAVGFVFERSAPGFVKPADAYEVMAALPPFVASVGVFANPDLDEFCDIEEACPVAACILAGAENEKIVRQCGPNVIKGLRFDPLIFAAEAARWTEIEEVDALLVALPDAEDTTISALADAADHVALPLLVAGVGEASAIERVVRAVAPYAIELRLEGEADAARLASAIAGVRAGDA